jgi:hypothetical protein
MAGTRAVFAMFALSALGLAGATSCTAADPALGLEKRASASGVVYYRVKWADPRPREGRSGLNIRVI